MKTYVTSHEWELLQSSFQPDDNEIYESLLSIGNGYMGTRANFEEDFSGKTLQGTYVGGVYYPDKTRVGWWKNGYPEYFAKVLNSINFIGIRVWIDEELIDWNKVKIIDFKRKTNMKNGLLSKYIKFQISSGKTFTIESKRFFSLDTKEISAINFNIIANDDAIIEILPYLDGTIKNQDSNYDEYFWEYIDSYAKKSTSSISLKTKKTDFQVSVASSYIWDDESWINNTEIIKKTQWTGTKFSGTIKKNQSITLNKYIALCTSRDYSYENVISNTESFLNQATNCGFDLLLQNTSNKWKEHWDECDIEINGDITAQQGIRFNIFHLTQTYTGVDPRLNIGPKGFTGEKYGGSTYWDTEAYCIPFYLGTTNSKIAKNLLIYRYNHLEKAKENARKLGFNGALYPMVTMNGEECHNEWEITFEEIHRNAAISYAIYNYVEYTGDYEYLNSYGFEVLVEISRFWADRVNYNTFKDCYMILGVTGPNEYDNNINNNWYTNRMAKWNLSYTLKIANYLKSSNINIYNSLIKKLNVSEDEFDKWTDIINKMYLATNEDFNIFLQQDGYLDKEQLLVKDLDKKHLPLNQNWSWDRILRSCFIKQADVLQGLFFLNNEYSLETKKSNFDFYEPRTVHESSLSPCVHSIIASEIGYYDKAYELYLRTARLDLDNYNNDTEDGLHITSMAGTWMSIIYGFGGFRLLHGKVSLKPFIPNSWKSYNFKLNFRDHIISVSVSNNEIKMFLLKGTSLEILYFDKAIILTNEPFIQKLK